jgi:capsular exopolysaccharide synthesis family protein
LSDALQPVTDEPGLSLLASGAPPPNPSELLASSRAREVVEALVPRCDLLIIDTPPVLPVTDALVVSRLVDAMLLVVTSRRSTKRSVHRAIELLRQVDAPLIGTVLNQVRAGSGGYLYEGGYGYGYGNGSTRSRRERKAEARS